MLVTDISGDACSVDWQRIYPGYDLPTKQKASKDEVPVGIKSRHAVGIKEVMEFSHDA